MANIMFYNSDTRAAAVGVVSGSSFQTTQTFDAGSFSRWTNIVNAEGFTGLLFYNKGTGAAALGSLSQGTFTTGETFPPGFFAPNWTHLVHTGSFMLFYRKDTGEGAIVKSRPFQTIKGFPAGGFARGWTHIVMSASDGSLMLFYNKDTGEGAIAEQFDNRPPGTGGFPVPNDIRTLKSFSAGSFSRGWSDIVEAGGGKLLFYNRANGAGALGTVNRDGFQTAKAFPEGAFKKGWTIVAAGGSMLFYNAGDGSAAIGFDPTVREFPAGSFSIKWTNLVADIDSPV